jgi:hypothetical protein
MSDPNWQGEIKCCHFGGIIQTMDKVCCGGKKIVVRVVACSYGSRRVNADVSCRRQLCRQYEMKESGNENRPAVSGQELSGMLSR